MLSCPSKRTAKHPSLGSLSSTPDANTSSSFTSVEFHLKSVGFSCDFIFKNPRHNSVIKTGAKKGVKRQEHRGTLLIWRLGHVTRDLTVLPVWLPLLLRVGEGQHRVGPAGEARAVLRLDLPHPEAQGVTGGGVALHLRVDVRAHGHGVAARGARMKLCLVTGTQHLRRLTKVQVYSEWARKKHNLYSTSAPVNMEDNVIWMLPGLLVNGSLILRHLHNMLLTSGEHPVKADLYFYVESTL